MPLPVPDPPTLLSRSIRARARLALAFATAILTGMTALGLLGTACRRAPEQAAKPSREVPSASRRELPAGRAASSGYLFTPAETGAVDDFLRRNSGLRPATDADRKPGDDSDAELHSLYGIYHPYFVRGDMNDDGVLDFALAFVRRDSGRGTPWFSIVVFTGRATPGASAEFSSGTFLERDVTLAHGDISVDRDSIVISPDLDEDTVRRYRWDPASHTFVFVRDGDDDPDSPSVSQTSARRVAGRGPGMGAGRALRISLPPCATPPTAVALAFALGGF